MLTGKERAALRAKASAELTLFQIGKGGMSQSMPGAVADALRARELVKIRVLESSGYTARDAADELAQLLGADVVQVIGARFVLYKKKPEKAAPAPKKAKSPGRPRKKAAASAAEGNKKAAYPSKRAGGPPRATASRQGVTGKARTGRPASRGANPGGRAADKRPPRTKA